MSNNEPLLLLLTLNSGMDIQKGKGNRDGLIQQIVTYVRDGHTVTRRQWVRSEFADHAKKDEEEKKDVEVREEKRDIKKRDKNLKEEQEKQQHKDVRARHKIVKENEKEETAHHGRLRHDNPAFDKFKEKLDKKKLEEEAKKKDGKKDSKDKKDDKKDDKDDDNKKKKHGAYGQKDQTKADNKRQEDMLH